MAFVVHQPTPKPSPAPQASPRPALNTNPVPTAFYTTALTTGLVLLELCGGICAGLEMVLRNGVVVRDYLYADIDPAARIAAQHRMANLAAQYPDQFSPDLARTAFRLPQDVRDITYDALLAAGASKDVPWLVVAGWPCQDLSPAGHGRGLEGARSNLFFSVQRILTDLQQLQPTPPAYMLENAAVQHNFNHPQMGAAAFAELTAHLGQPICLDAAQFNARVHRLCNYWTNLANPVVVQQATACWHRAPNLLVDDILDPNRTAQEARRDGTHPYYPANKRGTPLSALPTIVAYPGSHAYRDGRPGMVWDRGLQCLVEPNADERERAMGYLTGSTAAPGLTQGQRCTLIGNNIDQNLLQSLFAICRAFSQLTPNPNPPALLVAAPSCPLGGEGQLPELHQAEAQQHAQLHNSGQLQPQGDIWNDNSTLHYLRHGTHVEDSPPQERRRAQRRAGAYLLMGHRLVRVFKDGSRKEVPHPARRSQLIAAHHAETGHFGTARTISLLKHSYWWYGMGEDAPKWVGQCELCTRVRASFDAPTAELHPLPIEGLFYRWGVDLCGPFPWTPDKNLYVMVCIEHFSKHLVLVPLPGKDARFTAAAFLTHVLSKYGFHVSRKTTNDTNDIF
jgi:hypothetical protein